MVLVKKAEGYIEMNIGKIPTDVILNKVVEMGLDRKNTEAIFFRCRDKKAKEAQNLLKAAIIVLLAGILASVYGTSMDYYEYFYWYGPVLIGIALLLTAIIYKRRLKKNWRIGSRT